MSPSARRRLHRRTLLNVKASTPFVDQFYVTVPTDGFVYDEVKVTIP
jgi:hypothetical protein